MNKPRINPKYNVKVSPVAHSENIVKGDKYRFTVLTSRLIRAEYSEDGIFEDHATQTVVNREFPTVKFSVDETDSLLTISTEDVELTYTKKTFSKNSLSIAYIGKNSGMGEKWYYGEENTTMLPGTTRTLDTVNGECPLEGSVMCKRGMTCLDDSKSLIIAEDGWIDPRKEGITDCYIFCYSNPEKNGYDYMGCLKDYYKLTGKTPLIPRFLLGNWWSRYHAYTQDEYVNLVKRFKKEDIPFSVAVIDMDWHYVKIDPKYGAGWTGYTWNKELFPDYKKFLKFLKDEGMESTLNLHPADGVAAHEDAYEKMAESMGIDPKSEKRVDFDATNPKFLENYFEILHHPLEKDGVRFWWMDWQQGNTSHIPGLDPLWMLNHFHYIDNGRDGNRPVMFSRYSGPGSHRYPIGFSGDTIMTWESLDFQPYFTACASNIGYGWWSHDIGGHMPGYRDEELTCRWVQYGVFSPINRLHSTCSKFTSREPWRYNKICEISIKKFLKLRHELVPYLYTMNYRASEMDEPVITPLYYKWNINDAYKCKNEYCFGSEMVISPITSPHDDATLMGHSNTLIPEGLWFDFFTNIHYNGGRVISMYRDIYNMPVLVKAGGIIPMAKLTHVNDIENPKNMKIKVFSGASNTFELYEDDGVSNNYMEGKSAITKFSFNWSNHPVFTISAPIGDISLVPENRNFKVEFIGITKCENITVTENGKEKEFTYDWFDDILTVEVCGANGEIKISVNDKAKVASNKIDEPLTSLIEHAHMLGDTKDVLYSRITDEKLTVAEKISAVLAIDMDENMKKAVVELLTADER